MSIFKRMNESIAANFNAMIQKTEDPAKMVDYQYDKMLEEASKIKKQTAVVMADAKSIERSLEDARAQVKELQACAEKAVRAGNDEDARILLEKKAEVEAEVQTLEKTNEMAQANAVKMQAMYKEISRKLTTYDATRATVKAKVSVARTQAALNEMKSGVGETSMTKFKQYENKANRMVDQANALDEIDEGIHSHKADEIMAKYSGSSVDDELAALKASVSA